MFTLINWCRFTACLHLLLVFIFSVFTGLQDHDQITIPGIRVQATKTVGIWLPDPLVDNQTAIASVLNLDACPLAETITARFSSSFVKQVVIGGIGDIDTRYLIILFHALSFLFQIIGAWDDGIYYRYLDNGDVNLAHLVEYSFSASLMMIAICAQLGTTDVFLIISVACNCWGCMIFGVVAELLFHSRSTMDIMMFKQIGSHWIAHLAGWFLISVAMLGAGSNLATYTACIDGPQAKKVPSFVIGIVATELVLFLVFGFVQTLSFITRDGAKLEKRRESAYYTEAAFIALSISAKIILGCGIIVGNFINK